MNKPSWEFLRYGAMSVSADSMANPLRNTELTEAELLMREAIQNSTDEKLEQSNDPVKFEVSRRELRGEEKAKVVDHLQLKAIRERSTMFHKDVQGWFNEAQSTLSSLDNPDVPFSILSVSDYNTNGLGGRWNQEGDIANRFHNLVLSLGSTEKLAVGENFLGSYGVGKMVYALTSRIRIMAYYSVFNPSEASEHEHARFMATGFFPHHSTDENKSWTGHGFLGRKSDDELYPTRPIANEDAHQFVEAMGFDRREEDETGLTVFLFDCPITIEECRAACEKYWWPSLLDPSGKDYIKLEFKDEGRRIEDARPSSNQLVRPFIECYRTLQGNHQDLPDYEITKKIPKTGKIGGSLCLKAAKDSVSKKNLVNSVALIRGGLVIRYESKYTKDGAPEALGVFDAAQENMRAFTLSEPEAHDNWNPNHDRLKQAMGEEYQTLIRRTHTTIEGSMRDFQVRLEDRKEKRLADDADFLDSILGPIFNKKKGPPRPPVGLERAISIYKTSHSEVREGHLYQILDVSIALAELSKVDSAPATIAIDFKPLVSADESKGPSCPRLVFSSQDEVLAEPEQKTFEANIEKDYRTTFRAEAVAHPSWKAQWVVTVTADPTHGGDDANN